MGTLAWYGKKAWLIPTAVFACGILVLSASSLNAQRLPWLGTFPAGRSITVTDVSDDGSVVVGWPSMQEAMGGRFDGPVRQVFAILAVCD